ncbi:MAG: hypothetical protein KDE51_21990, partial [Anaerolineales bacterium]|nr:hypothetical protein [Anaerolineales bacterium]
MMNRPPENLFGKQLRFYRHHCVDPSTGKRLTQDRLGELLDELAAVPGLDGKRIGRWERGVDIIDHTERRDLLVGWLQVLHHCGGLRNQAEANQLLKLGQYSSLTTAEAQQINPNWKNEGQQTLPALAFTIENVLEVLKKYRLPYIEPQLRTPAGLVIWGLNRLQHLPYIKILAVLFLMAATYLALRPSFVWPILDETRRLQVYGRFVLINLLAPFFVAWLTQPDYIEHLTMETRLQRRLYFHLQWIGAQVGFVAFGWVALLASLAFYHLGLLSRVPWLVGGLTMLPLFMSYVSASRLPIDRHTMFGDEPKLHEADLLFWRVFIVAPAVLMPFFYFFHDLLVTAQFGGSLLVGLIALIIWHRRVELPQLNDIALLGIVGVLTPLLIFYFNRQLFLSPYPQNWEEWLIIITIMS